MSSEVQIKIHSDFTISDGTNDSAFVTEIISPDNPLNTPNVFASTDAKTTTTGLSWQDIQISSTGQYMVAVVGGNTLDPNAVVTGNVWVSTDYGENWTEVTVGGSTQQWISAMVSGDGSVMMVKARGNLLYKSTDYGVNWTQVTITIPDKIYEDKDPYGSSAQGIPGTLMKMAYDGSNLSTLYCTNYNGSGQNASNAIYRFIKSTDGGANWTEIVSTNGKIHHFAASRNGQYIVLIYYDNSTKPKYSDDFGATFIELTNGPTFSSGGASAQNGACISNTGKICLLESGSYCTFYNTDVTTGTVASGANDAVVTSTGGVSPRQYEGGNSNFINSSNDGKYIIYYGFPATGQPRPTTAYMSIDYGVSFNSIGTDSPLYRSDSAVDDRVWGAVFSDDNKYIAVVQENYYINVRKNTFIQGIYTPTTFADKLSTDLNNTVTAGGDFTTTDSTPYYRLYFQFANAVTLTGMPKYIFHIPFSDFSVKARGQVNLRNVNLDAPMTIATSYNTTSNTSTIPAGNHYINQFVSTIETDLDNFTLSYDASINAITFDGLAQDISMSITSNDTTIFDTSITEITTTDKTLPFITYGQPDPTLKNYSDNGITTSEFVSNGYTIPQLLAGSVIPDWTFDTDANHLAQSYVKDFIDISGSLVLRENANLTVNGNIETKGNITIKNQIMEADLSLNHNMIVSGDISMNGNVTVGDVSMNGTVVDCSFTDSSIPESAFNGQIGPDYTQPTILYEKGFDTTADVSMNANVQINNLKVDGDIEFSDGTTMNTYDDNIEINYNQSKQPGDYFDATEGGALNPGIGGSTHGDQLFCSSNGQYAGIGFGGNTSNTSGMFITRDFGANWTHSHLPSPADGTPLYVAHRAFNMSYDGKYIVSGVTANDGSNDEVIGLSEDYGDTWTTYYTSSHLGVSNNYNKIAAIAVNHDASLIVFSWKNNNVGTVYYSTDKMASWTDSGADVEGQMSYTTKIVNNVVFIGVHDVKNFKAYRIENGVVTYLGSSFGGVPSYSCLGAFSMGGPGSSDIAFFASRQNNLLEKATDINTTPVITNVGSVVNTLNYSTLGVVMSPSGKYVLVGENNSSIRPTLKTNKACYLSTDSGETFSTISSNFFNHSDLKSIAISDAGHFYGMDTSNKRIYFATYSMFKASTFTSLTINNTLTAASFSTSSDYRIKTDISQLDETVTLDNLRPVKYLQTLINKPQYGLIAHELQEYYPDLVVGEKDGEEWQRVNYTGLVALLINEIKQLKRELTELENGM